MIHQEQIIGADALTRAALKMTQEEMFLLFLANQHNLLLNFRGTLEMTTTEAFENPQHWL